MKMTDQTDEETGNQTITITITPTDMEIALRDHMCRMDGIRNPENPRYG